MAKPVGERINEPVTADVEIMITSTDAVVDDDGSLAEFRRLLQQTYGERLVRTVLYGSRARGDARPDSDYDVAVFLSDMPDRWSELNKLADLTTDILEKHGALIHAMPFTKETYDRRTPLMHELRLDGLDL